jgi:predicted nucleic acid-binding protein
MIVVSDTSAITSLIQIDRIALLHQLYGAILIPPAVERELRFHHNALPAFIAVTPIHDHEAAVRLMLEINSGEAEAIVLAKEVRASALLIDERKGRAVALREGVPIIGLVGALIAAKRKGILASLVATLDDLEVKANFRIGADLRAEALRAAGE